MKSLRYRHSFSLTLLALFVVAGTRVDAQVMDQVPATAMVVFKVKNISATNDKVIKLAKAFGLDQIAPDLADPLGAVMETVHIGEGLNRSGDVAFAIFDKEISHASQDDSMVALVPVSDYQAFLGNLKDVKEEGGIAKGKSEQDDKELYVAHWGAYAAISPTRSLIATKPTETMKLSGVAAKESDSKDAVLIANMEAIRPVALPKLKEKREQILDELMKNLSKDEAGKKFAPVLRALMSTYVDGAESFLSDATFGVIGLDLADDGVGATFLAEFKPDSDWGRTALDLKGEAGTKGSLLAGLPDHKYYAFGGYAADPKGMQQALSMMLDPLIKKLSDIGEDGKQMANVLESDKSLYGALHSLAGGALVANGALGQESIVQIVAVAHGDAKEIKGSLEKLTKNYAFIEGPLPNNPTNLAVAFKPDAKTIDGVLFDSYEMSFKADPNDPRAAQVQQISAMIFGANGLNGVFGAVDDNTALFVHGGTDKLISEAIAASKDPQDHLSDLPGVKAVAAHLPDKRLVEYYIQLDQIVSSGVRYAAGFGFPLKVRIPPNLPPIGAAVATDGPALRVDSFIPSQLVQSLVAAGMEAYTNIQGGPGGAGGPGGL